MKKLFVMALAAVSCSFMSCGKKSASGEAGADSTKVETQAEADPTSGLTDEEKMERQWADEPEQFDKLHALCGSTKEHYMKLDQAAELGAPIADLGACVKTLPDSVVWETEDGLKFAFLKKEGDNVQWKAGHSKYNTNHQLMDEDGLITWSDVMDDNNVFMFARIYNEGKTIAGYILGKKFVANAK